MLLTLVGIPSPEERVRSYPPSTSFCLSSAVSRDCMSYSNTDSGATSGDTLALAADGGSVLLVETEATADRVEGVQPVPPGRGDERRVGRSCDIGTRTRPN